jgi:hypothetical protein
MQDFQPPEQGGSLFERRGRARFRHRLSPRCAPTAPDEPTGKASTTELDARAYSSTFGACLRVKTLFKKAKILSRLSFHR